MRVLIVDDDEIDIALVKRELNSSLEYTYEIEEATSVIKGLALIDEQTFDLILLDYHMPEVNGIEMIIEIRSRPNLGNTAIVVISVAKETSIALNCIEAGAQDFITKSEISHVKLHQALAHSSKRFEMQQKMHHSYLAAKNMAEKDPLTGLANRYYFNETLKLMIDNSKRLHLSVALLALDLDDFKLINDSWGHDVGDKILIGLVDRVNECLRVNDGFARLGGDEFIIILSNVHSADEVNMIATRILSFLQKPFLINGNRIKCTLSIGAALYPNDADTPNQLIKCADIAMYRAKQNGKNTLQFYQSRFQNEFNRRYLIQRKMSDIIVNSSFRLFYQPIFSASDNRIRGLEAFIRWPDMPKSYEPSEFIVIAEETHLMHQIGEWIIDKALADLSSWQSRFDSNLTMSINLSHLQLQDSQLTNSILLKAQKRGILPESIILQITEAALLANDDLTQQTLNSLSSQGFKIALKNFGLGTSSVSHLNNFPLDLVKLDKSLPSDHSKTMKKNSLFEAITVMLKVLNLNVVATGIETDTQLSLCQQLNVDMIQGYLLDVPMPSNLLEAKLIEYGAKSQPSELK